MIVGSNISMAVGERAIGLADTEGTDHPSQPFVVLRVATRDEWIEEARRDGMSEDLIQYCVRQKQSHFYEVSVD